MAKWLRVCFAFVLLLGMLGQVSLAVDGSPDDGEFAIICFVLDGSTSINVSHFTEIKWALVRAIQAEILENTDRVGQVEISVVQFGIDTAIEPTQIRVELGPTILTADSWGSIRDTITGIEQGFGYTPTGDAIRRGTDLIVGSANFDVATRRIINIITDGGPYDKAKYPDEVSTDPVQSKQDAIDAALEARAAGIDELNVEGFNNIAAHDWVMDFFRDLAYPQPAVVYSTAEPTPDVGKGFVYVCTPESGTYNLDRPIHQKLREPFPTDTPTFTPTYTPTPTDTPIPTETPTPTDTAIPTNTPTDTPGPSSTPSNTPTNTPTDTPGPSSTPSATPTPEPTPVAVPEGDSGMLFMLGLIVLLAYGGAKLLRQGGGQRPA